jgi:hypothetical protein
VTLADAPSTMLRLVPLPRFAGEEMPAATSILPRSRGRWPEGTEGALRVPPGSFA